MKMKNLLLKGLSIVTAATMLCTGVFAAEIPYNITGDYSNNKVTISGKTEGKGNPVVLQILYQHYDDVSGEYIPYTYTQLNFDKTSKNMIFYRNQTVTNEKGEYSFVIEYLSDTEAGSLNARLVTNGAEELTDLTVDIVSSTAYAGALVDLETVAKAGVVADFIDELSYNSLELGMSTELLAGLNEATVKPYMDYAAKGLNSANSVKNTQDYNTYMLMAALEEGDVANIDTYIAGTAVFGTTLYDDYNALADDETKQTYITNKMSGKNFADINSFSTALKKALILEEVYYATGYGEVKDILSKYGSTVGITGTASNDVYKNMQGKDYTESTILEDYNKLKLQYGSGSNGGGGSAGGGGGVPAGTDKVPAMDGSYGGFESAGSAETVNAYFNDIDGVDWATEAILALADKGIINGKSEGNFAPDDFVTREEFAKILVGAMGYSNEKYQGNEFSDVKDNDWFKDYVNIAYSKNLIKGVGDGRFGSGQMISRQDMSVMIYNALKAKGVDVAAGGVGFEDKNVMADYALDAIGTLYKMGVINGVSATHFDPLGSATRAQAAKMVYGVLKYLQ